jgi:valyl-tRNA synthetase
MGWPEETDDLATFYPNSLLISGYDILFFWDTRMVMAGLEFTGQVPFETLYIHGMIQDELGRPMSKSLGNGIDPIDMVERFGADAVRYSLAVLTTEGQDMRLSESKFEMGRNFANKLWNASRLVLMNLEGHIPPEGELKLELADRWILSRYQGAVRETTRLLESLKYADTARELYAFTWNEYCDWYLELVKERLRDEQSDSAAAARAVLVYLLDGILRLLHPFMPFVTSEIWERLAEALGGRLITLELSIDSEGGAGSIGSASARLVEPEGFLAGAAWPEASLAEPDADAESAMGFIQEVVSALRNIKGEMRVPPGEHGTASIRTSSDDTRAVLVDYSRYVISLASLEGLQVGAGLVKPPASGSAVVAGTEIYLPLEDLIDLAVERDRLTKEQERLQTALRGAEAKLGNKEFISKAPDEVIGREREKRDDTELRLKKVSELLADLAD